MRTKLVAGLIVSAAIVASPLGAAAQVAAPKNADVGKAATQEGSGKAVAAEKKVCKQLPSSSSRLPKRVCLTTNEWKQVEEEISR